MSISLKPGVRCFGIHPEVVLAIAVAHGVFQRHGSDLTITSFIEGKHSPGSLHYKGYGFDARTWDLDDEHQTAADLRQALGRDFDVVVEATHIHVEFDPKEPLSG